MSPSARLRLPSFFADNMVLQRDKPISIFGWGPPRSDIVVSLADRQASTRATKDGDWFVQLPPFAAGGPHELQVKCGRQQLRICDILIGDLWFCSGQSNMEFPVARSLTAKQSMKKAKLPLIRHFQVERATSATPLLDVAGSWAICDPKTVGQFTAVGFYFAREVTRETGVPIGLIHSSWGGTPIEGWIPLESYRSSPALRPLLSMQKKLRHPTALLQKLFRKWERENVTLDPGNKGEKQGWARPDFDDRKWKTMQVPGFWEGRGLFIDGAVWFRLQVKIPKAWQGRELLLELGPLDDFDETYFNGKLIGKTGKDVPDAYRVPRVYRIPAELVRSGTSVVAIRIFDQFGSGGFTGQKDMLRLSCPGLATEKVISLAGKWRYHVEWAVERHSPVPQPPQAPEPRAQLAYLYNGMVHAFNRLPIRGFLWYQGESNAFRAAHYQHSFPLMIRAWRDAWRDDDLSFYFVQLANFKSCASQPSEDYWAELREAQVAALRLKGTGMAVAIDVGEEEDIHPRNKEAVGHRLALLALARTYGKKLANSGPVLSRVQFKNGRAHLEFEHTGSGLCASDKKALRGFALAGKNRRWVWARARIENKKIVVLDSREIQKPIAVRYGWASSPQSNLVNSDRLPAAPFRTDRWRRLSEGNLWPF